jgi:hypothetical protein
VAETVKAAKPPKPAPKPRVDDASPFADFRAVVAGAHADSVFKKMPLTAWARPARPVHDQAPELDETVALLTRFRLPVDVAGFAYPSGCRIRRVRVPAAIERAAAASGPVIVSKRTLEELRTSR